jgi:hypothetical protein
VFGKKKSPTLDINQIAGAAMTAFLTPDDRAGSAERTHSESDGRGGGVGQFGAVAVGAALALAARAAYFRARRELDLERVADAVEQRLNGEEQDGQQ